MSERYAFVMMVREKWWVEFCRRGQEGKKVHSFVVRGAAPPKSTSLVFFYVTKPVSAIAGYAEFIERVIGKPQELWSRFSDESVLGSKARYKEFVGDAEEVSFVRFKNLKASVNQVSLSRLLLLLGVKRLSRKGFYVNKELSDTLIAMMK
jgi:predicted transcriptional regulator